MKVRKAEFILANGACVVFDIEGKHVYVFEHECQQRTIKNSTRLPSIENAVWFYKNYTPVKNLN